MSNTEIIQKIVNLASDIDITGTYKDAKSVDEALDMVVFAVNRKLEIYKSSEARLAKELWKCKNMANLQR